MRYLFSPYVPFMIDFHVFKPFSTASSASVAFISPSTLLTLSKDSGSLGALVQTCYPLVADTNGLLFHLTTSQGHSKVF